MNPMINKTDIRVAIEAAWRDKIDFGATGWLDRKGETRPCFELGTVIAKFSTFKSTKILQAAADIDDREGKAYKVLATSS